MLLVVEDDEGVARAITRAIHSSTDVRVATSLEAARRELTLHDDLDGMILDVGLPDGNGLSLLEELRRERPWFPVLVYSAVLTAQVTNRAQALRAEYVCKPALDRIPIFAVECCSRAAPLVVAHVGAHADRHALPPAQRAILISAVLDEKTEEVLAKRDIALGTYKGHLNRMRQKLGMSLSQVVAMLRKRILRR